MHLWQAVYQTVGWLGDFVGLSSACLVAVTILRRPTPSFARKWTGFKKLWTRLTSKHESLSQRSAGNRSATARRVQCRDSKRVEHSAADGEASLRPIIHPVRTG